MKGKAIPLQAWTGPWSSQISRPSSHEGGKVVSPTHRPPLTPKKYSWYSFLLEAESTPGTQWGRKDYVNEKFQWHRRDLPAFIGVPQPTEPPGTPLCLNNNIKMKLNMYFVWHNYLFILLTLLYYLLLVSALISHPQANIYRKLKILRPKLVDNNRNNNKIIKTYIYIYIYTVLIGTFEKLRQKNINYILITKLMH